MNKTWFVARFEYLRIARKRSFLIGMFAIPIFFGVLILAGVLVAGTRGRLDQVGYVDLSGVLAPLEATAASGGDGPVPLTLANEAAARAALERGDVDAYYVIAADYLDTRAVTIYYLTDPPSTELRADFDGYLRDAVVADLPALENSRLRDGFSVTLRTPDGRTLDEGGFINLIVPGITAILFMFAVLTTGGYLMLAVSDERENRTVEVLATSVTPEQLIIGKAVGLIAAALTQLLVWTATTVVALLLAAQFVDVFARITVPTGLMALAVLFFIPSFALVSGLMTLVGSVIADTRQGQQVSALFNMLFVAPLFFISIVLENPDGILAVLLTLFPTTSMMTLAMRWGVTTVPTEQLVLAFAILVATAAAVAWMAPRVFRMGMLRYGQPLAVRHVLAGLRTGGR